MKLKDLKNDGVFEKKEEDLGAGHVFEVAFNKGSNQAKSELSEAELVVDEEKIKNIIEKFNKEIRENGHPENKYCNVCEEDLSKALASSMSEWLRLERGKE